MRRRRRKAKSLAPLQLGRRSFLCSASSLLLQLHEHAYTKERPGQNETWRARYVDKALPFEKRGRVEGESVFLFVGEKFILSSLSLLLSTLEKQASSSSITSSNFGESPFYRFIASNCIARYIYVRNCASRLLPGQEQGKSVVCVPLYARIKSGNFR